MPGDIIDEWRIDQLYDYMAHRKINGLDTEQLRKLMRK